MWQDFTFHEMQNAFEDLARTRFELWLLKQDPDSVLTHSLISKCYVSSHVQHQWVAWQESRADLARELSRVEEGATLTKGEVEFLLAGSVLPKSVLGEA